MTNAKMTLPAGSVRSVAVIDQELAELTSKIAPAEQALERAKKAATALEEQRRAVLVAARLDGDPKAAKRLDGLTPKVDHAALEVRDSEAVLDEIRVRIKARTGERLVAQRDELQRARSHAADEQVALSADLDRDLAALVEKCGAWLTLGMEQYQASADLNEPISPTPRVALGWVISQAFRQLAPFEGPPLRSATFEMLAERFADKKAEPEKLEKAS